MGSAPILETMLADLRMRGNGVRPLQTSLLQPIGKDIPGRQWE